MIRNRRILIFSQALVAIVLALSLSLVMALRLDRPVFIENYKDVRVYTTNGYYSADYLTISYLANSTDNRNVMGISFKGAEDLDVLTYEDRWPDTGHRIGRYTLRTVQLVVNGHSDVNKGHIRTLENATVLFSDGTESSVKSREESAFTQEAWMTSLKGCGCPPLLMDTQIWNIRLWKTSRSIALNPIPMTS